MITRLPTTSSPPNLKCLSSNNKHSRVRCMVATEPTDKIVVRRSGNPQLSVWNNDFVQSLTSQYAGERYTVRSHKLKAEVRMMLEKALKPLDQLELIDALQRLGLSYHFEDLIKTLLNNIFIESHLVEGRTKDDLYATALEFRLLRQHGYKIPQEVLNQFKDERGNFKKSLCNDLKGMLYLYKASCLSVEGESVLDEARDFTFKNLQKYVKQYGHGTEYLPKLVSHALEFPVAWRMLRLEAYRFINVYETKPDVEPTLLELAKLDFNMVQAVHLEDLKHSFGWWNNIGIGKKLDFARNWMMECFLWSTGVMFEPHFTYGRRVLAKICALITVMDDVYDTYGTLEELELFTDAVVRWDINARDRLPNYMKLLFLALYNYINEIAYDVFKDQGVDILPSLRKKWADYCKSVLVEAKWYYAGYTPTFQEYLDNARISVSGPLTLAHIYLTVTNLIAPVVSIPLEEYEDLIRWSCEIVRLADDLGTYKGELETGDVPNSIQCYMHENGVSKEEADDLIRHLISET